MVDKNKGQSKGQKRSKTLLNEEDQHVETTGPKPKRHLACGSECQNVSASAKKLGKRSVNSEFSDQNVDEGFILMDISLLNNFISELMRCPRCTKFGLVCIFDLEGKNGFAH